MTTGFASAHPPAASHRVEVVAHPQGDTFPRQAVPVPAAVVVGHDLIDPLDGAFVISSRAENLEWSTASTLCRAASIIARINGTIAPLRLDAVRTGTHKLGTFCSVLA